LKVFIPSPRQHCLVEIIAYSHRKRKTHHVSVLYLPFYTGKRNKLCPWNGVMNAKCHKSMPKFNFAGRFPLFVQDASHYCTNKYHTKIQKSRFYDETGSHL
jgi:hypothetical protein